MVLKVKENTVGELGSVDLATGQPSEEQTMVQVRCWLIAMSLWL